MGILTDLYPTKGFVGYLPPEKKQRCLNQVMGKGLGKDKMQGQTLLGMQTSEVLVWGMLQALLSAWAIRLKADYFSPVPM